MAAALAESAIDGAVEDCSVASVNSCFRVSMSYFRGKLKKVSWIHNCQQHWGPGASGGLLHSEIPIVHRVANCVAKATLAEGATMAR